MERASDALPKLALLAMLCGLFVGGIMLAFRLLVEMTQSAFLPGGNPENYEALEPLWRLALPAAGGLLIGLALQRVSPGTREVGPAHVLDCLGRRGGRLPMGNALVQLLGGAASIVAGHSVGREGPAIHLGAAGASLLAQAFRLSDAHVRVLLACGVAAAIAASFNTPLTGVVFAMEVILLDYSVVGFAPVILAAATATVLNRLVYGADTAFAVPSLALRSLWELPYVMVVGVAAGAASGASRFCVCSPAKPGACRTGSRQRSAAAW